MKTAIKTTETNYAQILDEMEDAFLDAPHPKSFTVPHGGFDSPAFRKNDTDRTGDVFLSYYEVLMVVIFSVAFGAYGMLVYVNRIKSGDAVFLFIDQLSKFLFLASLPIAWIALIYLYYRKKK